MGRNTQTFAALLMTSASLCLSQYEQILSIVFRSKSLFPESDQPWTLSAVVLRAPLLLSDVFARTQCRLFLLSCWGSCSTRIQTPTCGRTPNRIPTRQKFGLKKHVICRCWHPFIPTAMRLRPIGRTADDVSQVGSTVSIEDYRII